MRGGAYNRQARKNGGYRRAEIQVGAYRKRPNLAIQCFERRHIQCGGVNTLFGGRCECSCHEASK